MSASIRASITTCAYTSAGAASQAAPKVEVDLFKRLKEGDDKAFCAQINEVDIALTDERGRNILHAAFDCSRPQLIPLFLNHPNIRVIINQPNVIGTTPFMMAAGCSETSIDTLRQMIALGAIPNEVSTPMSNREQYSEEGDTALIRACQFPLNENQVAKARYIIEATDVAWKNLNTTFRSICGLQDIPLDLLKIAYNYIAMWGSDFVNATCKSVVRMDRSGISALEITVTKECKDPQIKTWMDEEQVITAIVEWQQKVRGSAQTATSAVINAALALKATRIQTDVVIKEISRVLATGISSPEHDRFGSRLMAILGGSGDAWRIEMVKLLLTSGANPAKEGTLLSNHMTRFIQILNEFKINIQNYSPLQVNPEVMQTLEKAAKEQEVKNHSARTNAVNEPPLTK